MAAESAEVPQEMMEGEESPLGPAWSRQLRKLGRLTARATLLCGAAASCAGWGPPRPGSH